MRAGYFIALEGIDGAGTSSQLQPVAAALRNLGHPVHLTAEPSTGPAGILARQALQSRHSFGEASMALLFAADRLQHVADDISPHLQSGHIVISDRYLMSSYAYQSTALDPAWVRSINRHAPLPDAHLLFRVTCQTAALRRQARGAAPERFDTETRQRAVAAAYERLLKGPEALADVYVIDAEQSIAQVTKRVVDLICTLVAAPKQLAIAAPGELPP